jgi:hypothetical protein
MPSQTERLIREIYELAQERDVNRVIEAGTTTFPFSLRGSRAFASTRTGSAARRPPLCGL